MSGLVIQSVVMHELFARRVGKHRYHGLVRDRACWLLVEGVQRDSWCIAKEKRKSYASHR